MYPSPAKPEQLPLSHSPDLRGHFQQLVPLTEVRTNLAETLSKAVEQGLPTTHCPACRTQPLMYKLVLLAEWHTLSRDFGAYSGLGIHLTEQSELLK